MVHFPETGTTLVNFTDTENSNSENSLFDPSLISLNLPITGRSLSAKRKERLHEAPGVRNPTKRLNTGEPSGPSSSPVPVAIQHAVMPKFSPENPDHNRAHPVAMVTSQDGRSRTRFKENFAYHRQNIPDYTSESDDDEAELSNNFDRVLHYTEQQLLHANRTGNNGNNDSDRPRRDLSPLNLSTAQKHAWNQVRSTRNKISEHTVFKAFLEKCKANNVFPDIVNVRRPPPGIFSRAPQVWDPEFQNLWNDGLKSCNTALLDATLTMAALKLELLSTLLDSNVTHLRGLLHSNRAQFERVSAIIDRLVANHSSKVTTKYEKMYQNLQSRGQTPAPPTGQGQPTPDRSGPSRRRDFQQQRTPQGNQSRGGHRGSPANRGRPKSKSKSQRRAPPPPAWTPQTPSSSNDNQAMLSMLSTMMAMMGNQGNQGNQPPLPPPAGEDHPPPLHTREHGNSSNRHFP